MQIAGNQTASHGIKKKILQCRNHKHGCSFKERLTFDCERVNHIKLEINEEHDTDACHLISVRRSDEKSHGLTMDQKRIIEASDNAAPKQILKTFRKDHGGIKPPTSAQISSFKAYGKGKQFGVKHEVTTADLRLFCHQRSRDVLSKKVGFNEDTAYLIADIRDGAKVDFVIGVTTDRLVKLPPDDFNIHADDTHKTNIENLPFNVVGWPDYNRRTHPIIGALSSHTNAECYQRTFQMCNDLHPTHKPRDYVADAAEAIPNGARLVFEKKVGGRTKRRLM